MIIPLIVVIDKIASTIPWTPNPESLTPKKR